MTNKKTDKRLPASERRKIILDAATRTFVESGYRGAHMDVIAERADVTKPILYRHFPSKLSLLLAILDRAGEELLNTLAQPVEEGANWRASIENDVRAYLDFVENYGVGYSLIYTVGVSVDQEVAERMAAIRSDAVGIIAQHMRLYVDPEVLPPEEIDLIAYMIGGMAERTAFYWTSHEEVSRDVCERNLIRGMTSVLAGLPAHKR
jgi:AcrR family transcriptional regulator